MTIDTLAAPGQFARLLESVARGESIAITEAGQTVAMLVPPPGTTPNVPKIVQAMLAERDAGGPVLGAPGLLRGMIDDGRR